MKIDAIMFDLDGTLWNPSEVVLKIWNKVISETEEVKEPLTKEQLDSSFGMQLPQIGEKFFPYLDSEAQQKILNKYRNIECDWIREVGGRLFEDLEEVLQKLSGKYELYIVSNCQKGYIEAFLEYHQLGKYFKDYECAGNTGLIKGENIKLVIEKHQLKNSIYVGDAQVDCDGAKFAGIPFVYASYGFGQVTSYDYAIKEIGDLLKDIL